MHDDDFEAPQTVWVVITVFGGIATGFGLIFSLEYLGDRLFPESRSIRNSAIVLKREAVPRERLSLPLSDIFSSIQPTSFDPISYIYWFFQ